MVLIRVPARTTGGGAGGTHTVLYAMNLNDAVNNNENNSYASPSPWNSTDSQRRFHCRAAGTWRLLSINVSVNNNTIDGATLGAQVNTVIANQLLTFDQATGEFDDDLNTDAVVNGDDIQFNYQFGNSNITVNNLSGACDFS